MSEYNLDCSFAPSTRANLDDFTFAYIEAAMWTLTDDDGNPMDYLGLHDIAEETIVKAIEDCAGFRRVAGNLLDGASETQAGHDFWLTRNHHGAGFWDRAPEVYPNDTKGEVLTRLANAEGGVDWYIGDNGLVYQE